MGTVGNEQMLKELFNYCINEGNARPQDIHSLFVAASQTNRTSQRFVWAYFKENMDTLLKLFGSVNSNIFRYCLRFSIELNCDEKYATEFEVYLIIYIFKLDFRNF